MTKTQKNMLARGIFSLEKNMRKSDSFFFQSRKKSRLQSRDYLF